MKMYAGATLVLTTTLLVLNTATAQTVAANDPAQSRAASVSLETDDAAVPAVTDATGNGKAMAPVLTEEWVKIGETKLKFKNSTGELALGAGADGCTAIRFNVTGAPVQFNMVDLTFDAGDHQSEALNTVVQKNGTSRVIELQVLEGASGNRGSINANGDCLCNDGKTVCHKGGSSPAANCYGCGGDACKDNGGFTPVSSSGDNTYRTLTKIEFDYSGLPTHRAKSTQVEVWGQRAAQSAVSMR
jgi:hypothetical protein